MSSVSNVSFRVDRDLKNQADTLFQSLGLNMTTAFTIFAKKVRREKRIPFDLSIDPFYSESNISYLNRITSEIDSGEAKLAEHPAAEDE